MALHPHDIAWDRNSRGRTGVVGDYDIIQLSDRKLKVYHISDNDNAWGQFNTIEEVLEAVNEAEKQ